jgi:hypothetical protein
MATLELDEIPGLHPAAARTRSTRVRITILTSEIDEGWMATALIGRRVRSKWCATKSEARQAVQDWLAEAA